MKDKSDFGNIETVCRRYCPGWRASKKKDHAEAKFFIISKNFHQFEHLSS